MNFLKNFVNASLFAGLVLDLLIAYLFRFVFDRDGGTSLLFWYIIVVGIQYFFMAKNSILVFAFYLVRGMKHVELIVDQFVRLNYPIPSILDSDGEEYLNRVLSENSHDFHVVQTAIMHISSLGTLKASAGAARYIVGVMTLNKAVKMYREFCLKNNRH
jgi:hypothetical protein